MLTRFRQGFRKFFNVSLTILWTLSVIPLKVLLKALLTIYVFFNLSDFLLIPKPLGFNEFIIYYDNSMKTEFIRKKQSRCLLRNE